MFDTGTPPFFNIGFPLRLTAPVAGTYLISGNVAFVANAAGRRVIALKWMDGVVIGGVSIAFESGRGTDRVLEATTIYRLAAGEWIELLVGSSGTMIDVEADPAYSPHLMMARVGA